jgi:hypothetical protein
MTRKKPLSQLLQTPEDIYRAPAEVVKDRRLSEAEKKEALANWEADETALLRADDENMSRPDAENSARAADMISDIRRAGRRLASSSSKEK